MPGAAAFLAHARRLWRGADHQHADRGPRERRHGPPPTGAPPRPRTRAADGHAPVARNCHGPAGHGDSIAGGHDHAPKGTGLAYHHFGVPAAGDYDCSLETFEKHLRWLKKHDYESILPQQLVDAMHGKATLPAHPVMLTFDDNNAEQYLDAAPLLSATAIAAPSSS